MFQLQRTEAVHKEALNTVKDLFMEQAKVYLENENDIDKIKRTMNLLGDLTRGAIAINQFSKLK